MLSLSEEEHRTLLRLRRAECLPLRDVGLACARRFEMAGLATISGPDRQGVQFVTITDRGRAHARRDAA